MIEKEIRDFLVQNLESLSNENCFVGTVTPDNSANVFCVVRTQPSPLSDSHKLISEKLTLPKGINQKSISLFIEADGESYEGSSTLIWEVFAALGGEDGGCINVNTTQMFITPVESPFCEEQNKFKFNFIVRTNV